ncbi:hypothetical protein ACSSVZ_004983 [Amorphus sp. MBR-141]
MPARGIREGAVFLPGHPDLAIGKPPTGGARRIAVPRPPD